MKRNTALVLSFLASPSDAIGIRDLIERVTKPDAVNAPAVEGVEDATVPAPDQEGRRQLQTPGCDGNSGSTPQAWHPTYSAGWTNGYCRFTQDCNTPAYFTQLACCKGAYTGQVSGVCLSQLPNPPSLSPTQEGGLDVYYPDYNFSWPDGKCINVRPLPNGRPTYSTMLACCKAAYAGQISGNCLDQLPNPPTSAPTNSAFEAEFFYPMYELPWADAGCSNELPLPYPNVNDRPNYPTMIACCKAAYGGQMSGACLARLPSPPTGAPTSSAFEADFWYPRYETPWANAVCTNRLPLTFATGGRPTYATKELCCAVAYAGQTSRACVCSLDDPPVDCSGDSSGTDRATDSSGTDRATVVLDFSDLAMDWVRKSERGPTISTHFVMYVTAALFDAYAAFEDGTTGAVADLEDVRVPERSQGWSSEEKKQAQQYAMADAAHRIITELGQTLLDQQYLEAEDGEDAAERLQELLSTAQELRDGFVDGVSGKAKTKAEAVSAEVSSAILSRVNEDGSNFQNDYVDTTGYAPDPWISPEPIQTDPLTDYDFTDSSFVETFNTYDAELASQQSNEGFAQVNPDVESGTCILTETFQTMKLHGILPSPGPLTPQWGGVTPMTLASGSQYRGEVIGPYDEQGDLDPRWVAEAQEVVDYACKVQAGTCPACRATSEYWELGDSTVYPPGWWVVLAIDIAREKDFNVEKALQLVFGTALATFDSGVAAWEMKYFYDTVRPFTLVNEIFQGSTICDWRGNRIANVDDHDHWRPYQQGRGVFPPFPDNPSGHSTFSTSSSVVLRNLLGTNFFAFTTEEFASRFDTEGGFDGDPANGNEDITLQYDTFSEAADAAGLSRLFGGIHAMQGNVRGLEIGARVGHSTVKYLRHIFGDDHIGLDPVADVENNIVFGSGADDALLVAPCSRDGPVEVYGFYGDDVLEFDAQGACGQVSLFGGDGADTFRIGASATIQDYKPEDTIVLLQDPGTIRTITYDSYTSVFVGGLGLSNSPVVNIAGDWDKDDLNISFES